MAIENSVVQVTSPIYKFVEYRDLDFQKNAQLTFSDTSYVPANDRIYDVRTGADIGITVQILNLVASAVSVDFLIQGTNVAFQKISELSTNDDDWETLQTQQTVLADARSIIFEYVRATPRVTAIRIRLKANTAGNVDVKGHVGWF